MINIKRRYSNLWLRIVILGVALVVSLTWHSVSNAQEPERNESTGYFAQYYEDDTESTTVSEGEYLEYSTQGVGILCRYETIADRPHRSGQEVSVHGSWKAKNPDDCPLYADVEVQLQAHWCNDPMDCDWVTIADAEKRVLSGGGRGKRATARRSCTPTPGKLTGYRNVVDVDLVGVPDLPGKAYNIYNLECTPNYPNPS